MNHRISSLVLTGCFAALLSASPSRAVELLDERIDISVEKAAAADLFKTFAQIASLEPDIDPAVTGEVSLRIVHVRLETALNAACETVDCRWRIAGGKLRVEPLTGAGGAEAKGEAKGKGAPGSAADKLASKIDIKLTKADAREVFATFKEILSASLDLAPAVKGKVTLNLEQATCREALDEICQQVGCRWRLDDGDPLVLRVSKK